MDFKVYFIDMDNFDKKFMDVNKIEHKSVVDIYKLVHANKLLSDRHRQVCRCQENTCCPFH